MKGRRKSRRLSKRKKEKKVNQSNPCDIPALFVHFFIGCTALKPSLSMYYNSVLHRVQYSTVQYSSVAVEFKICCNQAHIFKNSVPCLRCCKKVNSNLGLFSLTTQCSTINCSEVGCNKCSKIQRNKYAFNRVKICAAP